MEYGTRDVGLETAAASNGDDESCRSRSRSRSSSSSSSRNSEGSAATSDWPLESKLALAAAAAAGLGLQQPPSGAALLLNSLYSLHALHSGPRLWRGEATGETSDGDEPKDPARQEKEETGGTSELPMLSSWMLSAYASMLGRLSAVAACNTAAVLEPDCTDTESRSSDHSSAPQPDVNDFLRSRESSPSCSLQKQPQQSPAKRKRSRATTSTGTAKRARKKRTDEEQCKSEAPSSPGDETAGAASATTSTASAGKKRGLQALQRVRYRYEREEYRCGLCSYACTIEKAFERHLRDHARGQAQESRVSCAVCGADRSSELDLSKHMRRHRDNRYFCCDICIFRTVQLKKLIQHRRMHTGEKPHLCPHCSYRSARRDNLRSHVRRVHKKENLYQDTFSPRAPHFLKRQARSIVADVVVPLPADESEAETEHPLEQSELHAPELKLESRPLEHSELQSESRVSDVEPEEIDSSDHALQPSPH